MVQLTQILLLLLGLSMFKIERKYKLAIFLFSSICLDAVGLRFLSVFGIPKFFLSICFIMSELLYLRTHLKDVKKTILYPLICMMIIATGLLCLNSPHYYHSLSQITKMFTNELLGKYFLIIYAFISMEQYKDLSPLYKIVFYGMVILTLFGIHNLITKNGFWINVMYDGIASRGTVELGEMFTNSQRFRVQAMFSNPFNYGYICILVFLFYWFGFLNRCVGKLSFIIVASCCIFGIISCGCRTILVCFGLAVSVYSLYAFHFGKMIKYILLLSVFLLTYVIFIGNLSIDLDFRGMFDTKAANIGIYGSSLGMRLMQLSAVFSHIENDFLFGRGQDYFLIDMGWGDEGIFTLKDHRLYGLEGVYLNCLLERGIIGLLFWITFYTSIWHFLHNKRRKNRELASWGISVLAAYISFANMTGELSSPYSTLLFLGIVIKFIYLDDKVNEIQYHRTSL